MPNINDIQARFLIIITLSVILTYLISIFILFLYRRNVSTIMRQLSSTEDIKFPNQCKPSMNGLNNSTPILENQEILKKRHLKLAYMSGGLIFSIFTSIILCLIYEGGLTGFIVFFIINLLPLLLAICIFFLTNFKHKMGLIITYIIVIFAFLRLKGIDSSGILLFGFIDVFMPCFSIYLLLSRKTRAVAPMVMVFFVFFSVGAMTALLLLENYSIAILSTAKQIGFNVIFSFYSFILLFAVIFSMPSFMLLFLIRYLYTSKKITDYDYLIDPIFLIFGLYSFLGPSTSNTIYYIFPFIAFFLYKLCTRLILINFRSMEQIRVSLLILRVFSLGQKSRTLFNDLSNAWRYIGDVKMIAGPDLAISSVEPHEFLNFITGKLKILFIRNNADLNNRLNNLDEKPDYNGRFRINEFFCQENTWKTTLSSLLHISHAVFMDLRGFSMSNHGCSHEIQEIISKVPLSRAVFAIDSNTDKNT